MLLTYLKHHYVPERMVVAGVGVEHGALVESVEKYFMDIKPVWEQDTDLAVSIRNMNVDSSVAQYTGGMVQVKFAFIFICYGLLIRILMFHTEWPSATFWSAFKDLVLIVNPWQWYWFQHQSVMGWQWGQGPWKNSSCSQVSDVLCYKPISIIHCIY